MLAETMKYSASPQPATVASHLGEHLPGVWGLIRLARRPEDARAYHLPVSAVATRLFSMALRTRCDEQNLHIRPNTTQWRTFTAQRAPAHQAQPGQSPRPPHSQRSPQQPVRSRLLSRDLEAIEYGRVQADPNDTALSPPTEKSLTQRDNQRNLRRIHRAHG